MRRGVERPRRQHPDVESGHRSPHRATLDLLAGRVADQVGGLGLPVAVAYGHTELALHLCDHVGVKRLADPALMVEIECMAVIPTERFKPAT